MRDRGRQARPARDRPHGPGRRNALRRDRKRNQPSLHDAPAALPWPQVKRVTSEDRAHGRIEQRTVKALTPGVHLAGFGWRDVAQVAQVRRRVWRKKTPTAEPGWTDETVYVITSLPADLATTAEIGDLVRGQWVMQDRVHHVRDAVMGEDKHTCRTGSAPAVWATIRNTAISPLRRAGHRGIAAATRSNNRDPKRIFTLIA